MKINWVSKGHPLSREQKSKGQVRAEKKIKQVRNTHKLESAKGGTSYDLKTDQASKGYSLPGEGRRVK
jgi:hypothetical protein